ncbi:hypothetical protein MMC13_004531 [Lambiella insularis]|nr:hypothetical protein [Lambiella insularis]
MYYSARGNKQHTSTNERCLGVAYYQDPLGPFNPDDELLYCPPGSGCAVGVDGIRDDHDRYILFKDGSNVKDTKLALWKVDPADGKKVLSKRIITKEGEPKYGREGLALAKMLDGRWLLLHATGKDTENYRIHWATADHITGPFHKGQELLGEHATSSGSVVYQPGGPDFVGGSNTKFVFFGSPVEEHKTNRRDMYYGELFIIRASVDAHGKSPQRAHI